MENEIITEELPEEETTAETDAEEELLEVEESPEIHEEVGIEEYQIELLEMQGEIYDGVSFMTGVILGVGVAIAFIKGMFN